MCLFSVFFNVFYGYKLRTETLNPPSLRLRRMKPGTLNPEPGGSWRSPRRGAVSARERSLQLVPRLAWLQPAGSRSHSKP